LVLFGGNASTSGLSFTPLADLWSLDLVSLGWQKLEPTGTPPPARLFHAMAADASAAHFYVYGGGDANPFTGPFFRDLWSLDLGKIAWAKIAAPDAPVGRIKFGLALAAGASPSLVAFGGHDDGALGNRNDVFRLDLQNAASGWTTVSAGDVLDQQGT